MDLETIQNDGCSLTCVASVFCTRSVDANETCIAGIHISYIMRTLSRNFWIAYFHTSLPDTYTNLLELATNIRASLTNMPIIQTSIRSSSLPVQAILENQTEVYSCFRNTISVVAALKFLPEYRRTAYLNIRQEPEPHLGTSPT